MNALKNAKMLTTKKLYFPEQFTRAKKETRVKSKAKIASVNLESDASDIMEATVQGVELAASLP